MLHEFLSENRAELIATCKEKVLRRPVPAATDAALQRGVPHFLEQLILTLRAEASPVPANVVSITADETAHAEMALSAGVHGGVLYGQGFSVGQVVHDYGDLCQAITELAMQRMKPLTNDEFHTLNRCLDDSIADAVSAFQRRSNTAIRAQDARTSNERLGCLAHELRNLLGAAILAFDVIKTGEVAVKGATGAVVDRALNGMCDLIDRSFAEVRLGSNLPLSCVPIPVGEFIAEIQIAAALEARIKGCGLTVAPVAEGLTVEGDRPLLAAAVANLLQNAFKFTRPHTDVALRAYASGDRALMEVEDRCGGLQGEPEELIRPFEQRDHDRTGLGLGLSIARRAVEASEGKLRVRSLPGVGCVFTVDLPRMA